jgi:hypothetical protein
MDVDECIGLKSSIEVETSVLSVTQKQSAHAAQPPDVQLRHRVVRESTPLVAGSPFSGGVRPRLLES